MTAEEYSKYLYQPKLDKYAVLGAIKREGDYGKIKKIFRSISSNQFVKSVLRGNAKVAEYEAIRMQKDANYSGNLIGEISWTLLCIEESSAIIDVFMDLKSSFENFITLGQYSDARSTLNQIEELSGKSIWSIESNLLLQEYQYGVEENWKYLSEISKRIADPIVLITAEHLSKRVESKVSYFRFNNILVNQIDDLSGHRGIWEYFNFKLNPLNFDDFKAYAFIVNFENQSPIVDRYLTVKRVLYNLFCKDDFSPEILLQFYKRLYELFPRDIEVLQILSLLEPSFLSQLPQMKEIEGIFEEYNRSEYQSVVNRAEELIRKYPTCMELYELYVRSLVEADFTSRTFSISPIVDQIIDTIFNIYSQGDEFEHTWDSALKLGITFLSARWAKQYLSIVKSATSVNSVNKNFSQDFVAFSSFLNPRLLYFVPNSQIETYVVAFERLLGQTSTLQITAGVLVSDTTKILGIQGIEEGRRSLYLIRALMRGRKFLEAKDEIIEVLKSQIRLSIITKEEFLVHLFRCHLKLNESSLACVLFVDNYLKNSRIVKRFNTQKLLDKLDSSIGVVLKSIDLPIFLRIATNDSYRQYVGYDTYMSSIGASRPTQLLGGDLIGDEKLMFFLREVCTIEVMHHSYYFEGTEDIENERMLILNRLIVIDSLNEPAYIQELSELNQSASIRMAMREVNKGRISVNVKQLRETESQNVKEAFHRFKEIEIYSKNRDLLGIDTTKLINEINTSVFEDFDASKVVYTNDPAFISFKVIFIEIRDKFLLSKEYGLDGYLSTRIRHGTLLNHIRSVFESHHILSQKDKAGNYLENEHWGSLSNNSNSQKVSLVSKAIQAFSHKIDAYTDSLVKDFLQVKTEKYLKKPNGWFDYSLSNNEIGYLFTIAREEIKDSGTFINFIFEFLEEKTEIVLDAIRERFFTEVKETYEKYLASFYVELEEVFDGTVHFDLKNSISLCGTALQQELTNISEWFHLSNTSKDIILDLKVVIQTAVQITNTIYPNFLIRPSILQSEKVPLAGTVHLIYVFRILFDNIIKHSRLQPGDLKIEVKTETVSSQLRVSIKNNISDDIDLLQLEEKLGRVKDKWKSGVRDFERVDVEGDSGFDKIRRIIVFDLEIKNYSFDFFIGDGNLEITISLNIPKILKYEADENIIN